MVVSRAWLGSVAGCLNHCPLSVGSKLYNYSLGDGIREAGQCRRCCKAIGTYASCRGHAKSYGL